MKKLAVLPVDLFGPSVFSFCLQLLVLSECTCPFLIAIMFDKRRKSERAASLLQLGRAQPPSASRRTVVKY